ncbi:hypothetical protein chiPu_0024588, partial [Chiloscyllium punctatum]|nr:hypothetical protein [Chiloscyllium punctatum]
WQCYRHKSRAECTTRSSFIPTTFLIIFITFCSAWQSFVSGIGQHRTFL